MDTSISQQKPLATKTSSTFNMSHSISCTIQATPECIWALLTDAAGFPSWNSTVTSLEGDIALGKKLALRVPLDPKRTFKPTVTAFQPKTKMEWSDGAAPMFQGVRTFSLVPNGDGSTTFTMSETLSGIMLPLIKGSLPDFGPTFETYATDLKRAAEKGVA